MLLRVVALVVCMCVSSFAPEVSQAGPNAGGTLIIHSPEGVYSGGPNPCGVDPIPDCQSANVIVPNTPDERLFNVYAVFSDENEPDLRGVEFGVTYGSDVYISDFGDCSDFEQSQPGWPRSGTGTRIIWFEGQTERLRQVYWFVAYSYAEEPEVFTLGPHPETGGHFADGSLVPLLDQINDYGSIGFGAPGHAPCPEPGYYYVTAEGGEPFPTIQSAINIAGPGSLIELQDGIYRGDGNRDLNLNNTALTVRSESGNPDNCVIDCEGSAANNRRGIYVGTLHDADARVEGIKIINGYAGSQFQWDAEGGGVKMTTQSRLTLTNCIVENCFSEAAGGGIDTEGFLEMVGCVVRNNSISGLSGAGLSAGQGTVRIEDCLFQNNVANAWGGGLRFTNCELEVKNSQFFDNRGTDGGGIALSFTNATFDGCSWAGNEGSAGGALHCISGSVTLDRCTISENTSPIGSGIYTHDTDLRINESIISFGAGGAAIRCGGPVAVSSSDIYGNAGGDWVACLADQLGVDQNFSSDPLYCNSSGNEFTLDSASPCLAITGLEVGPIGAWPVGCGDDPSHTPLPPTEVLEIDVVGISGVFPNPFSLNAQIQYTIPQLTKSYSNLQLSIFDSAGRRVRRLDDAPIASGVHTMTWDGLTDGGDRVSAGVFYVRMWVDGYEDIAPLTVLR